MNKEDVVCVYTKDYYLAITKNENNTICSNMDGSRDHRAKWSKSERERQIPYDTTYMWNLKNCRHEDKTKDKKKCVNVLILQETLVNNESSFYGLLATKKIWTVYLPCSHHQATIIIFCLLNFSYNMRSLLESYRPWMICGCWVISGERISEMILSFKLIVVFFLNFRF